jgi:hypothetical protein
MRHRRGSGKARREKEETDKWEKILAEEGLASLPDSVESDDEPAPTEFEETSEVAQDQPSEAVIDADEDDLPTYGEAYVDEDDEEDEITSILKTRLDINIVELEAD